MGYTHYWYRKVKTLDKDKWQGFLADVQQMHLALGDDEDGNPIEIKGWDGTGEPEFTDEDVRFNGNSAREFDHETFHIPRVVARLGVDGDGFAFCKTAQKPYDLFVCACLLAAKKAFGKNIEIHTDGDAKDWAPAIRFAEPYIGTKGYYKHGPNKDTIEVA